MTDNEFRAMIAPHNENRLLNGRFDRAKQLLLIMCGGLMTTSLSLFAIFVAVHWFQYEIMSMYIWVIVPMGTFIVGIFCGLGCALVSKMRCYRIGKRELLFLSGFFVLLYFSAKYCEFFLLAPVFDDGSPVRFFEYCDHAIRSASLVQGDGSIHEQIGVWGYLFQFSNILGFVVGGLVVAATPSGSAPKCKKCSSLMKKNNIFTIPSGIPMVEAGTKLSYLERKEYDEALNEAMQKGFADLQQLQTLASDKHSESLQRLLEKLLTSSNKRKKLTGEISMPLTYCKRCNNGYLSPVIIKWEGTQYSRAYQEPLFLTPDICEKLQRKV